MLTSKRPNRRFLKGLTLAALCLAPAAKAQQADATPPIEEWMKTTKRDLPEIPFGLGLKPTSDAGYARSPRLQFAATRDVLPGHLVLDKYLPPVASQGRQGSCVGWSLAYYAYTYAVSKNRRLTPALLQNPKFQFSPAYLYHQGNGGKDTGMSVEAGCRLLTTTGCSSLLEMPYDDKDAFTPPNEAAVKRASNYKSPGFGYLFAHPGSAKPQDMKMWLAEAQQPFVMGIPVFKDFARASNEPGFVYSLSITPTNDNFLGGHAICCIGYDSDKRAFRVINSWGTKWGDNGQLWVSEDFLQKYALCGYAFVAGGPIAREGRGKVAPHIILLPAQVRESKPILRDRKRLHKAIN